MYEFTDKICGIISKKLIQNFYLLKNLLSFDELNVLSSTTEVYNKCYKEIRKYFQKIASYYNPPKRNVSTKESLDELVEMFLGERYSPVSGYIFDREYERKKARCYESLMASPANKSKLVDTALRYVNNQVKQAAIELTDEATIAKYKGEGVTRVKWVTAKDEKVCEVCNSRDGKVYPINKIPPKPHIGCRCYVIPYSEDK